MADKENTEQTFSEETRKIIRGLEKSVEESLKHVLGSEESIYNFTISAVEETIRRYRTYNPKNRINKLVVDFTTGHCEAEVLLVPEMPLEEILIIPTEGSRDGTNKENTASANKGHNNV